MKSVGCCHCSRTYCLRSSFRLLILSSPLFFQIILSVGELDCQLIFHSSFGSWSSLIIVIIIIIIIIIIVESGYNNIGLCNISYIASDILWYIPINTSLLTITLCCSVRTTFICNDTKYFVGSCRYNRVRLYLRLLSFYASVFWNSGKHPAIHSPWEEVSPSCNVCINPYPANVENMVSS